MIPRHFHFVFGLRPQTEPFHVMHYLCLRSCIEVNRPDRIRLYYHYMPHGPYWDAISGELELVHVELNELVASYRYADSTIGTYRYAHLADFVRIEKLIEHGGVYADIDTLFLNPIPPEWFQESFVIGREMDVVDPVTRISSPSLCNAFLMSDKDAPFARLWLQRMSEAFDGTWSRHSTLLPKELADAHPDWVRVEPPPSFYSVPPSPMALFDLLESDVVRPSQSSAPVYSIHLWEHLWWSPARKDFSDYHHGLLTEASIRDGGSQYERLARRFLPASTIAHTRPTRDYSWIAEYARACAGATLLPLIRIVKPKAGRLDLARGYFAHHGAKRRFKTRTKFEQKIVKAVIQWNEYGIFDPSFRPDDVIIDCGAHIGSFTYAAHYAGSRQIHSFEPDVDNHELLQQNVGRLAGIHLYREALFRNDLESIDLSQSREESNTGASTVLFGGRTYDFGDVQLEPGEALGRVVSARPLDSVLRQFPRVHLLKVDCEGSEFPMLLTSRELHRVDRIVGEFHEVPMAAMPMLTEQARIDGVVEYSRELLRTTLEVHGFRVMLRETAPQLGLFEATR